MLNAPSKLACLSKLISFHKLLSAEGQKQVCCLFYQLLTLLVLTWTHCTLGTLQFYPKQQSIFSSGFLRLLYKSALNQLFRVKTSHHSPLPRSATVIEECNKNTYLSMSRLNFKSRNHNSYFIKNPADRAEKRLQKINRN